MGVVIVRENVVTTAVHIWFNLSTQSHRQNALANIHHLLRQVVGGTVDADCRKRRSESFIIRGASQVVVKF